MRIFLNLVLVSSVIIFKIIAGNNIVAAEPIHNSAQISSQNLKNNLLFLRGRDIWAYNIEKHTKIQLTDTRNITNYTASSDASIIAYFKNNKKLYLYNIKTGTEEFITEASTDATHPSLSPSCDKIAFVALTKDKLQVKMSNFVKPVKKTVRHVWIVDVKSKKVVDVTKDLPFPHSHVNWSPDGRWLSFASYRWEPRDLSDPSFNMKWKVYLMDLNSPNHKTQEIGGGSSSVWLNNNQVVLSDGVAANVLTIYDVKTRSKKPASLFKAGLSTPIFSLGGENNEVIYYEVMLDDEDNGGIRSYNIKTNITEDIVNGASAPRYIK